MKKYLNLEGLEYLCGKIKEGLERKQEQLTGRPGQLAGFSEGGLRALTVTAGSNIKLSQAEGKLEIGVNLDNGTINGGIALLDTLDNPGIYNWLDTKGDMGYEGGLWNVAITKSKYIGEKDSVTQTLVGTYGTGTKGRVLARSFYYANNPQWTPWRELVSLEQISNPNMLDNWYFQSPINQRREKTYNITGINQYFIDRWIGTYINTVLEEDGLLITSSRSPTFSMYQRVENPQALAGKTVTFSLLCSEAASVTMAIRGDIGSGSTNVSGKNLAVDTPGLHTITCKLPENVVILAPGFLVRAGGRIKVIAAKLELGSQQTLAHKEGDIWVLNDPPPNPALELLKCQKYFERVYFPQAYPATRMSDTTIKVAVPFCTKKRIASPAVVPYQYYLIWGENNMGVFGEMIFQKPTETHVSEDFAIMSFSQEQVNSPQGGGIYLSTPSAVTPYIDIDANL